MNRKPVSKKDVQTKKTCQKKKARLDEQKRRGGKTQTRKIVFRHVRSTRLLK
jgi:hypothetical protein